MSETLSTPAHGNTASGSFSASEVEEGRLISLLGYIFPIIAVFPIVQRRNGYSLYHAKQALTLLIAAIAAQVVLIPAGMVLGMLKLGIVSLVLSLAFLAAVIGLTVLGAINAWNGRCEPLPVTGPFAERLLGGFTK